MITRQYILTITHDGPTDDSIDAIVVDYLTNSEFPFLSDYSPPSAGDVRDDGYEGPFIHNVTVEAKLQGGAQ